VTGALSWDEIVDVEVAVLQIVAVQPTAPPERLTTPLLEALEAQLQAGHG
jgi:hypothetical protein